MRDNEKLKYILILVGAAVVISLVALLIILVSKGNDGNGKNPETFSTLAPDGVSTNDPNWEVDPDFEPAGVVDSGNYVSNLVTFETKNGCVISAGTEEGLKADRFYLNLSVDKATEDQEYGFFVSADAGGILTSSTEGENVDSDSNKAFKNFVVVGRFFDECVPATYVDDNDYGVSWIPEVELVKSADRVAHVRVVGLKSNTFIGCFDIVATYDKKTDTVMLKEIVSADAADTGELTQAQRDELVSKAIAFVSSSSEYEDFIDEGFEEYAKELAYVDRNKGTYFGKYVSLSDGLADYSYLHSSLKHVFAVTIPIGDSSTFITLYAAPYKETIDLDVPDTGSNEYDNLTFFGYDPINPINRSSMPVPPDFYE